MRSVNGMKLPVLILVIVIGMSSCRKPGTGTSPSAGAYDPAKDPLVNPPSLFEPAPKDRSQVATDETLVIQLDGSPNTLNPLFKSSLYEFMVTDAIYGTDANLLFMSDSKMKWRPNEDVVASFTESEDHTEYIVKIKPGFMWHDGQSFTAHDVVFSWQQILDPQVPSLTYKAVTEPITECTAVDDYTVRYILPTAPATARWNLMFAIVPKHIYEKDKASNPDLTMGSYYNRQARHPIGNGPYRIVEWKENDKIVVERWEGYAGTKPYFKRIIFKIIPDTNISLLSFEKGNVDVVRRLTSQQFAYETDSEAFRQVGYKAWGAQWAFAFIGWNMDGSNAFFKDRRVRYAMTHALNVPLILEKVFCNLATPCHGIYHPDSWMYNTEVKPIGYDPEKSKALLDEAGWKVDPNDGWRYKVINGERTKFEFTLTFAQGSSTAPKMAAIFQEDLKRLGIQMRTEVLEWATFLQTIRKHEFQAETAMWGTGEDPDQSWNLWRTEEYKTGRNYGGYSNPQVDELFERGRHEFDIGARRKIYQKIHKLIYEDQPYTWVYNAPILAAFNKRIHGVQLSPKGIYNFDPSFMEWWIPAGQAGHAALRP